MADENRLISHGMPFPLAQEVARQIDDAGGGGNVSADDVTVGEVTAANFTFAGGTLTAFCQAIADAIPEP